MRNAGGQDIFNDICQDSSSCIHNNSQPAAPEEGAEALCSMVRQSLASFSVVLFWGGGWWVVIVKGQGPVLD